MLKVESLNKKLKTLTPEDRNAIFYKVTHDGSVDLVGTGLQPLVDRSERVTLAIPRVDNLDGFEEKPGKFATDQPGKHGTVSNQTWNDLKAHGIDASESELVEL